MDTALVAAVLGPIAAALVGFIFASAGSAGRIQRTEHLLKRVELIEKCLLLMRSGPQAHDAENVMRGLQIELTDIAASIRATSIRATELALIEFDRRRWYRRIIPPMSPTPGGRLGPAIFYLYLACTLAYSVMPFLARDFTREIGWWLLALVLSAMITIAARQWAIRSARNCAILERAKRVLVTTGDPREPA